MANPKNKWLLGLVSAAMLSGAMLLEGHSNDPIIPIKGDVPTVCYGETKVAMRHYTDAECLALLKDQLPRYGDGVLKCIDVPITQNEHAAYTLFAYNEGVYAFCTSAARATLNRGDHAGACRALATKPGGTPAWSTAGGRYVQGLQNRRQYERNLCLKAPL